MGWISIKNILWLIYDFDGLDFLCDSVINVSKWNQLCHATIVENQQNKLAPNPAGRAGMMTT